MTKKTEETDWTIEIMDIRKSIAKIKDKKAKASNMRWVLSRKILSYCDQIANMQRMEDEILVKHGKIKITKELKPKDAEKEWNKLSRSLGLNKLLGDV